MLIIVVLLFVALYNLVLAGMILLQTAPKQPGRIFAGFLTGFAVWIVSGALMMHPRTSHDMALWEMRTAFFCDICYTMAWAWFCLDFPRRSPRFRGVIRWLTAIGIVLLFAVWTPWCLADVTARPWWVHLKFGPLMLPLMAWIFVGATGSIAYLMWKAFRDTRGMERLQVQYILLGIFPWAAITIICNLILPAISSNQWMHIGLLASLIPCTATAYAVIQHRLMGLRFVLRAGVVYSVTAALFLLLFMAIVPVLDVLFTSSLSFEARAARMLLVFVLAMLFYPVNRVIQTFIDERFFKSLHDYRVTLREAGKAFASMRQSDKLVQQLCGTIRHTLGPQAMAVYVTSSSGTLVPAMAPMSLPELPASLPVDGPFCQYARTLGNVLAMEELRRQGVWEQEIGTQLQSWGAYVAVPLVASDQLAGMIFLGEKIAGGTYTAEDMNLLQILGTQVAVALDNASHYEKLQRLNSELEQRVAQRTAEVARVNAYLETAIDMLPLPICFLSVVGGQGVVVRRNPAMRELLGDHDLFDSTKIRFLDPLTRAPLPSDLWPHQRALHGERIPFCELLVDYAGEEEIPMLVHAAPIQLDGDLIAAVMAFQDISPLKAEDRAKDEFLAILSHELMTPLTAILGWTDIALGTPSIMPQALEVVLRNAQRQRRLISDLLDVSRIIHKKLVIQTEITDLWGLTQLAADNLSHQIASQGLTVKLLAPTTALPINADPDRVVQVVSNLLNNAMKHTTSGGVVTLAASARAGWASLTVSDTGRGLPPDELTRIFSPFQQAKEYQTDGGLGLGLALVKGIVELHHGRVAAFSEGIGCGSSFTVDFPLLGEVLPNPSTVHHIG